MFRASSNWSSSSNANKAIDGNSSETLENRIKKIFVEQLCACVRAFVGASRNLTDICCKGQVSVSMEPINGASSRTPHLHTFALSGHTRGHVHFKSLGKKQNVLCTQAQTHHFPTLCSHPHMHYKYIMCASSQAWRLRQTH